MICPGCQRDEPDDRFQTCWLKTSCRFGTKIGKCYACRFPVASSSVHSETGALQCCRCRAFKADGEFPPEILSRRHRPSILARRGRARRCRACKQDTRQPAPGQDRARGQRRTQARRAAGAWYPGCGRPHPRRKYVPGVGDWVRLHQIYPPVTGKVLSVDVHSYTACIRTPGATGTYRWPDFRRVGSNNRSREARESAEPRQKVCPELAAVLLARRAAGEALHALAWEYALSLSTLYRYAGPSVLQENSHG